jgi:CheY-like chemotaxis protein
MPTARLRLSLDVAGRSADNWGNLRSVSFRSPVQQPGFSLKCVKIHEPGFVRPSGTIRALSPDGPLRVLLVDDYADSLEFLAEACSLFGCEVRVADGGELALTTAAELIPHIAILDIGLPDLNGYEVARRIKAIPGLGSTWLVALTGYHDEKTKALAAAAGFDEFIVKPIALQSLEALLLSRTAKQGLVSVGA